MSDLARVMQLLIDNAAPLSPEYRDHPLRGEWKEARDCHIAGDWVLIYRITATPEGEEIIFVRTGSHAEIFK